MNRIGITGFLLLVGGMIACTSQSFLAERTENIVASPQSLVTPSNTASPTKLFVDATQIKPLPINTLEALPLVDPYSQPFQQPITDPVADWRPPLYPTPWIPTPYDHFLFS
ncbi:MAG: hypothetical protein N3D16_07000, partial [Anaerolineales bacterium]|nr:hypothetical protein [Anaerolineales bacterium]